MTTERPRATLITPEGTRVTGLLLDTEERDHLSRVFSEGTLKKLGHAVTLAGVTWHFSGPKYESTTDNLARRIQEKIHQPKLFNNPSMLSVDFIGVENAVKAFAYSPEDHHATSRKEMALLVDLRVQKLVHAINDPQPYLPLPH